MTFTTTLDLGDLGEIDADVSYVGNYKIGYSITRVEIYLGPQKIDVLSELVDTDRIISEIIAEQPETATLGYCD